MTYPAFPKIPRLHREVVITEKLDGTNALVRIWDPSQTIDTRELPPDDRLLTTNDGYWLAAGSRKRWLSPQDDNFGFASWVWDHAEDLAQLGPGHHYGEWWGQGINRGYGLTEKRFSLFNTSRWLDATLPEVLDVVPTIARGTGEFLNYLVQQSITDLYEHGSFAAPGFMNPEGIVVYHDAANALFKVTLQGDAVPKSAYPWRELYQEIIDGEIVEPSLTTVIHNPIGTAQFETELATAA